MLFVPSPAYKQRTARAEDLYQNCSLVGKGQRRKRRHFIASQTRQMSTGVTAAQKVLVSHWTEIQSTQARGGVTGQRAMTAMPKPKPCSQAEGSCRGQHGKDLRTTDASSVSYTKLFRKTCYEHKQQLTKKTNSTHSNNN